MYACHRTCEELTTGISHKTLALGLLQVATSDRVFLFDLIALGKDLDSLDEFLVPVFSSSVSWGMLESGFSWAGCSRCGEMRY